jgi:RNA polymerase sigma factor (sigma-70 family)
VTPPPFQSFIETYAEDVWRFLSASVGPAEADDCWQETFMAALRAYPRLDSDSNLKAWVLKIAQRKAIDSHRSTARRPVPIDEVPDSPERPLAERDPDLWESVRALPHKQRLAIVYRYASDLGYADIAGLLGCSVEAARRSVHEGLKKLREEWTQ